MAAYNPNSSTISFRAKAFKEGFIHGLGSVSGSFLAFSAISIHHLLYKRLPFYGENYLYDNDDQHWFGEDLKRVGNDMKESIDKFERAL